MLIKKKYLKAKGFSLIELMLSLFLGSLLLAMVIGLYVEGVSNGAKSAKYSRLRTDLQSMLTLMQNDIRRAGYGGEDFLVKDNDGKKITVKIATLSDKHCIIYSYDHKLDNSLDSDDKLAFCYNASDKTLQFATDVGGNSSWSTIWTCLDEGGTWSSCITSGNWNDLSDPNFMKITALTFNETTTSSTTATLRNIEINLTAELVADSAYTHSINTTVQVRNVELD